MNTVDAQSLSFLSFRMSPSDREPKPDSSAESSVSSPARKIQRPFEISVNANVSASAPYKYQCEVQGCTSKGVYPRNHDGLLACKAHKKHFLQGLAATAGHALSQPEADVMKSCIRASCKLPAWDLAPRLCPVHAAWFEENVPGYNDSLMVRSLKETGKRPVWPLEKCTGDPDLDDEVNDPVGYSMGHYWTGPPVASEFWSSAIPRFDVVDDSREKRMRAELIRAHPPLPYREPPVQSEERRKEICAILRELRKNHESLGG